MSSSVALAVPAIPEPQPTLPALVATAKALKAGVEALAGFRGAVTAPASTATASIATASSTSIARKFTTTVGDGRTTSFTLQHKLNVSVVLVQAYATETPYGLLELASVERSNPNATTVVFSSAPLASGALVLVIG